MTNIVNNKKDLVSFFRGIAILMVVMVHSFQAFDVSSVAKFVPRFGQMGCQFFFILSAYCLCMSNAKKATKVGLFYSRRFLSLAPGYWMTILINLFIVALSTIIFGYSIYNVDTKLVDIILNLLLLHGFVPFWGPMNSVVMGGWFVGTLAIFYLLFPILHKLYFYDNLRWKSIRPFIFPLGITIICSLLIIISGIGQDTYCVNSSVKYFSFINQLPSFAFGFSLYDLAQNGKNKFYFPLAIVFFLATIVLFYNPCKISFVYAPTLMTAFVLFLFLSLNGWESTNKISSFICNLGDKSYAIYLSHFWIMFALIDLIKELAGNIELGISNDVIYLLSLPFTLLLVYLLAMGYDKMISWLKLRISSLLTE